MNLLYLADRLSIRGGADLHLRQVIEWARGMGWRVNLAVGRIDPEASVPEGVGLTRVRGLAASTATGSRLESLGPLTDSADVIHAQNVMNPEALRRIVDTGKAVITVQDHRVFCPGMGKTLPDGTRCSVPLENADCSVCLADEAYRQQVEALTAERLEAICGATLIVLSNYMAEELAAAGLGNAVVIPPWVGVGRPRDNPGDTFVLAGRLVRHKGVADGWRAWTEAGRPLPLKVMGEGPLAGDLEGADSLGWVDHRRCAAEVGRARALLFPSFWQEPFGMLGIEALAQGTPVIAAPTGGMADWVDAGCITVESGDVSAFSDAVSRLAADPSAARALGEAGRVMVGERFCHRALAPRLEAVYEGLNV
ncbi:MAG: glycosyltransferase family 4 protein, partial [Acidobacteriota bacterium]